MNEENEKKPDLMSVPDENETQEQTPIKKDSGSLRKRLISIMGIILGIIVFIILVLFIIQLFSKRNKSYEDIETIMKNAALDYYKVQKDLLPKEEGGKDSVDASTLSKGDYMKPLKEYVKEGVSCTGEVSVEKVNNRYVYTPYLDCGDVYKTKEVYRAVIEQGVVTSGYGLYQLGKEYVYRGEDVDNYVTFGGATWQIVKVNSVNQVELVLSDFNYMPNMEWDNRYNETEKSQTGINTYSVSRIKEALEVYYKENTDDTIHFTKEVKDKLAKVDLCVSPRSGSHAVNDNGAECRLLEKGQMLGLLTVSDYLNASADTNCHKASDYSCQNYNYLNMDKSFWLLTPDAKNTKSVFFVSSSGYIRSTNASNTHHIRPVVWLNSTVMTAGGNGTKENPFKLK